MVLYEISLPTGRTEQALLHEHLELGADSPLLSARIQDLGFAGISEGLYVGILFIIILVFRLLMWGVLVWRKR